jgi:hypothetical protein
MKISLSRSSSSALSSMSSLSGGGERVSTGSAGVVSCRRWATRRRRRRSMALRLAAAMIQAPGRSGIPVAQWCSASTKAS